MDTQIALYTGNDVERTRAWATMPPDERRRRAVEACQMKDATALWELTESHLVLHGPMHANMSPNTRGTYRRAIRTLVLAWREENLLHPRRDAGGLWVSEMQRAALAPSTITLRLAAARALYAALRWAGATTDDPLRDTKSPRDPVPPWEKRQPYAPEEIESLLRAAAPADTVLVLLGAHAGLRASEAMALRWADVDLERRELVVQAGKGGKKRTVPLSRRIVRALRQLRDAETSDYVYVLPYRTRKRAWERIRNLAEHAGVEPRGLHSLRHAAGTRLAKQTGDLQMTARLLGHAQLETTRIYSKWSDDNLRHAVEAW